MAANPYLEGNPYLAQRPRSNTGNNLINLGLKLYSVKKGAGMKMPEWKFGGSKAGEALDIPKPTVGTDGLEAFDFGKGGEQLAAAPEEATAPLFDVERTSALVPPANEYAVDGIEGLDAFDWSGTGLDLAATETGALTAAEGIGEYGALSEGELAAFAAEDAALAESGVTAGEVGGGSMGGNAGAAIAYAAAANMFRNMYGQPNRPYEDKSILTKAFAAPGNILSNPGFGPVEIGINEQIFGKNNPLSKLGNWLGQAEENIVGKSLDRAFKGDFTGSIGQFFRGFKGLL